MGNRQGRYRLSRQAKLKGQARKRRRHKAERRAATADVREKINEKRREEGHPGWRPQAKSWWD